MHGTQYALRKRSIFEWLVYKFTRNKKDNITTSARAVVEASIAEHNRTTISKLKLHKVHPSRKERRITRRLLAFANQVKEQGPVFSIFDADSKLWLLDSGCNYSQTPHRGDFKTYTAIDPSTNQTQTASTLLGAVGEGTVCVQVEANHGDVYELEWECKHVPGLNQRLLSQQHFLQERRRATGDELAHMDLRHDRIVFEWSSAQKRCVF